MLTFYLMDKEIIIYYNLLRYPNVNFCLSLYCPLDGLKDINKQHNEKRKAIQVRKARKENKFK